MLITQAKYWNDKVILTDIAKNRTNVKMKLPSETLSEVIASIFVTLLTISSSSAVDISAEEPSTGAPVL